MNKKLLRYIESFFIVAILAVAFVPAVLAQETVTVTNEYANCRLNPGAGNKYMGRVYRGAKYELLGRGKAPNGKEWYKILVNGKHVYICSSFASVSTSSSTKENATTLSGSLKIIQSCNVRAAAGQNNKYLGRAAYGAQYRVLGSGRASNGRLWYKIQYSSQTTGWVCSSFVSYSRESTTNANSASSNHGKLIDTFQATAYCGCEPGGKKTYTGYSLVGKSRTDAMTIAVDPRIIPLNTRVYIEFPAPYAHFSGIYTARDTGGAIKGTIIDLYIGENNISEARAFGRRNGVKIYYA